MGSGALGRLLLLLSSLLLFLTSVRGESLYIINTVGLRIQPENKVQSGTKVTIHCQASVSSSNISDLEYLFTFLRDGVEIHTANTTKDSVDYEINPARVADSGNYECWVSVMNKQKSSYSRKLDVTGLQTPILHLNTSTLYESEEFKVACRAPEEKGRLAFSFYKTFRDGHPLFIKRLPSTNNFLETALTLRHIGDCFLSCDYEIILDTGTRRSNSSNEVQVKVKELNITPNMTINPNDIYEPDIVEVICRVQVHLETIEIFLIKDQTILKRAKGKVLIHRYRPKVTDSGELVCKAEWRNVQKESYKTLVVKEVFAKPQLTLEPRDLFEGDTFRLNCSVNFFVPGKIDPKTFKYHLYKDGVKLSNEVPFDAVAHSDNNGNYSCKAEGIIDSFTLSKESQTIHIKAKVLVSDPVLSVVGGEIFIGKSFQLICHSSKGTPPIKYVLFTPNGQMVKEVSKTEELAVFHIPKVSKTSDLNKFLCHAQNNPRFPVKAAMGQQLLRSTNIIEPISKPQLTVFPSTDVTEGQIIKLVCSVQTGSHPINFTWYHQESPLISLSTHKLKESHSISSANRKHVGNYYCTSTNAANELKRSDFVYIGVKLAGWKTAIIIVFCILLFLTFALVVALKTRLLRFKRKRTGNLSVKSAGTKVERLSLTQAEVIEANATPSMMGKSVWSDHVSGSESDDQGSSNVPEKPEPQYTEVQIRAADPAKAPVNKGTDTVYSEVRNSQQGVPEAPESKPVEYAQLNHDNHPEPDNCQVDDQSPNNENMTETENNSDVLTGDPEEGTCDPVPDC